MGMGVARGRFAMSGPARVGYTDMPAHVLIVTIIAEIIYFALRFIHIQLAGTINHSHTGTIITTILQTAQTLNQDRESVFISYITNYSTHTSVCLFVVKVLISAANLHIFLEKPSKKIVIFNYLHNIMIWLYLKLALG
jgi:hypothetical protein